MSASVQGPASARKAVHSGRRSTRCTCCALTIDHCQESVSHTINFSKTYAAANNSAAPHRIYLRKQRVQKKMTDNHEHGSAVISRVDGFESGGNKIEPVSLNRGGRHVGQITVLTIRCVNKKEVQDARLIYVPAVSRK